MKESQAVTCMLMAMLLKMVVSCHSEKADLSTACLHLVVLGLRLKIFVMQFTTSHDENLSTNFEHLKHAMKIILFSGKAEYPEVAVQIIFRLFFDLISDAICILTCTKILAHKPHSVNSCFEKFASTRSNTQVRQNKAHREHIETT